MTAQAPTLERPDSRPVVFPDVPKAFSHACPEPLIPIGVPHPDDPDTPAEPPEDEPQS